MQLLDSVVALPQISDKDDEHIELASNLECDFIIVNHTRDEKMIYAVKNRFKEMGTFNEGGRAINFSSLCNLRRCY